MRRHKIEDDVIKKLLQQTQSRFARRQITDAYFAGADVTELRKAAYLLTKLNPGLRADGLRLLSQLTPK
jgi:hypothetical protein